MIYSNDLYYFQYAGPLGLLPTRIYAIRPIAEINFMLLVHSYMGTFNYWERYVQVFMDTIGGRSWVTVPIKHIKHNRMEIK